MPAPNQPATYEHTQMSRGCQVRVKCLCTHEIHYYFIQLQDEGELVFVPSLQDTALTNQRDISPWSGVGLSGVEVRLTPLSRSLSLSLGPNAKERSDRNLPTIDRSVFVCCCCCVGALVSFSAPPHSSLPLCGAAGHVLSISVSPRHHQHHRNLPQLLINPLPRSRPQ